jgi:predicted enzyme related to lactoylglutathione lyase
MRQFFTDAFGWSHAPYGPDYAEIHAGLAVGVDSSAGRVAAPMPVIRAEDLEQAERDVVTAGGTIIVPAFARRAASNSPSMSRKPEPIAAT